MSAELIVYEDSLVIHKVNREEVLEYSQPQFGGGVANKNDPEIKVDGTPLTQGYIGLQAEGQGVEFRSIRINELDKDFSRRWKIYYRFLIHKLEFP